MVKVNRVVPRQAPDAQRLLQERQQYMQWWSGAEGQAYYDMLKKRYKAEVKAPRPSSALQAPTEN